MSKDPASAVTATTAPKGQIIYVGPNRAYDLPLMHNQIFLAESPPDFCSEALKGRPHLKACFVPVADLGKALASLKNSASDLGKAAAKVARETIDLRSTAKGGK